MYDATLQNRELKQPSWLMGKTNKKNLHVILNKIQMTRISNKKKLITWDQLFCCLLVAVVSQLEAKNLKKLKRSKKKLQSDFETTETTYTLPIPAVFRILCEQPTFQSVLVCVFVLLWSSKSSRWVLVVVLEWSAIL